MDVGPSCQPCSPLAFLSLRLGHISNAWNGSPYQWQCKSRVRLYGNARQWVSGLRKGCSGQRQTLLLTKSFLVLISKLLPLLVWLSWWEHQPINWRAASLIPGQGTRLGCGLVLRSHSECMPETADQYFPLILMLLSFSLSLPSPVPKVNEHVLRWGLKKIIIIFF